MNLPEAFKGVELAVHSPATLAETPRPARWFRALVFLWKYLGGMWLCQSLLGSVVVVGWTYRLMQRTALEFWWKRSAARTQGMTFDNFMLGSERTRGLRQWPNWIVQSNREAVRLAREKVTWRNGVQLAPALVHSLRLNFRTGVAAIFNTWVLTLPGCVLWLFSWYDGWNNSFNKGYEQAVVGPLTGLLGVAVFIAAMFYVPMTQARQASTGAWRSFYQFGLVWRLVRRRWFASVGLGVLYAAASLPLVVFKVLPAYFSHMKPALSDAPAAEVLRLLNRYHFWVALVVFPAFVILRLVAARIYASALLSATQRGAVTEDELGEAEWEALHRLDLLQIKPQPVRHVFVRMVAWAGSRAGRAVATVLLALVWFAFVAQIYASEFMNYHPGIGFLNQPLVQLPWFRYIPSALESPWVQIAPAILLLLAIGAFRLVGRLRRAFRTRFAG